MGLTSSRPARRPRRNDPPSESPSRTRGLRILRSASSNNPFTALGLSQSALNASRTDADGGGGPGPDARIRTAYARRRRHLQPHLAANPREKKRFERAQTSLERARNALLKRYRSGARSTGQRIVY